MSAFAYAGVDISVGFYTDSNHFHVRVNANTHAHANVVAYRLHLN